MQVGFTSSSWFEWHHVRKVDFIDYKLVWRFVTGRTNTSQHSPPTNHLLWPFEKHWMMNRWRGCTLWGGYDKRCVAMQRHDWNHQWPNSLCHLACTHHQDTFMSCCWDLLTKLSTHGDLRNWFGITWKEAVTKMWPQCILFFLQHLFYSFLEFFSIWSPNTTSARRIPPHNKSYQSLLIFWMCLIHRMCHNFLLLSTGESPDLRKQSSCQESTWGPEYELPSQPDEWHHEMDGLPNQILI